MTEDRVIWLLSRHVAGELGSEELRELAAWANETADNHILLDRFSDPAYVEQQMDVWKSISPEAGFALWVDHQASRRRLGWRRLSGWAAAAVLVIAVVIASLLKPTHSGMTPSAVAAKVSGKPGRSTATLTLANGQQILLDTIARGFIGLQGTSKLVKADDKRLSYEKAGDGSAVVSYNILTTPKSGQYQLTLPDGSRVWLNNVSSLRYPTSFLGQNSRTVQLTGEAYFEVASDAARPFVVQAGNLSVQVLGTAFNVSSYPDEPAVSTTLVQGRVRVEQSGRTAVLLPGQQVDAATDGGWKVLKEVNVEAATDWRNGLFDFDNADLHSALRQLARWYDVDVEFRGAVPVKRLQGQIHRDLTLNQVLEILEDKDVHFILQGRKLIVLP
jgi:transmembrane sensor